MTTKYFAILTSQGAARLANATALGTKLNITQMAVGDGNGTLPTPDAAQTKLINQKRIAPLNMLSVDPANTSQIIAEQVIPENEGGFWIREIGLYDDAGVLIAVANCPETYKPQLQEGSGRTQTIRMILIVSGTSFITLKIDPSVVLATRQYVDNAAIEVKAYAGSVIKDHLADEHPHTQYLLVSSALKELAAEGLLGETLKNLGLGELALAGVSTGLLAGNGYIKTPLIIDGVRKIHIKQWRFALSPTLANGVTGGWNATLPLAMSQLLRSGVCVANGAVGQGACATINDIGTPAARTDNNLPASNVGTVSGAVLNNSGSANRIGVRWEVEGIL